MNTSTHTPTARRAENRWLNVLISAHPSIDAPDERRKSELLSALSLGFLMLVALGSLGSWLTGGQSFTFAAGFAFSIVALFSYLLSRTSRYARGGYLFVIGFSLLSYLVAFFDKTTTSLTLMLTLSLTFLLANLLSLKQMALLIGINLGVTAAFTLIFLVQLRGLEVVNTLGGISAIGLFVLLFAWHRNNLEQLRLAEILKTQASLEKSNLELQGAQHEVNTRFAQLRLAAEVGQAVSQVRDLRPMLTDAVELIRARFDLYYAQVYLTNLNQTALILQAGTGAAGAELVGRGHQLPVNTASINGRAVVEKRPVVIEDTSTSVTFKPNPLLPETRSEMAVPLIGGETVVGVLDLQSRVGGSLNEDDLPVFEALAGQLAVAIQNANLLAQTEQARTEVESLARRLTREGWQDFMDAIHKPERTGFVFEKNTVASFTEETQVTEDTLLVPISIVGETIGNLAVEIQGQSLIDLPDELINIVARQVSQQIENLRLLESAERYRVEAEQASRRLTHEGWQEYLEQKPTNTLSYLYDLKEVRPCKAEEAPQLDEAALSLPLKVRDETIGKLAVQGLGSSDEEAASLAAAVAERLGAHIEGLRLSLQTEQALATTRKQAQREQALRQITSAVRGSTDPSVILRTAARELGNMLGRQTVVRLETSKPQEPPAQNRSENDLSVVVPPVQEA